MQIWNRYGKNTNLKNLWMHLIENEKCVKIFQKFTTFNFYLWVSILSLWICILRLFFVLFFCCRSVLICIEVFWVYKSLNLWKFIYLQITHKLSLGSLIYRDKLISIHFNEENSCHSEKQFFQLLKTTCFSLGYDSVWTHIKEIENNVVYIVFHFLW